MTTSAADRDEIRRDLDRPYPKVCLREHNVSKMDSNGRVTLTCEGGYGDLGTLPLSGLGGFAAQIDPWVRRTIAEHKVVVLRDLVLLLLDEIDSIERTFVDPVRRLIEGERVTATEYRARAAEALAAAPFSARIVGPDIQFPTLPPEVVALIGQAIRAEHHVAEGWLPDAYAWEPTYYAEVHLVGRLLTLRL